MNLRLTLLCSLLFTSALSAGTPKVNLTVQVESENQDTNKKDTDEFRARWLKIRVLNNSTAKLEGLTLKWTLYADDLQPGTDQIVVEKSGVEIFGVEAAGKYADISTPKVVYKWTPQHAVKVGSGRNARHKAIPETGHRYHGYAVQVLLDGVVIGEAYSQNSLRKTE